ncbi:LytR/AlgR family response regulator transcription factor [Undibacterium flavidum]|nr:LytTR family DNA-binding domain-containing protein [Undibacterium flavidum]
MPLRALIVDDEVLARQRTRQLLDDEADFVVIGEASNGVEAVTLIESLQPDLVFLDIQMPLLDGFGVIDAIGAEHMPATLFCTAFDAHAVKAFEVHAVDYLLKPLDRDRFKRALAWVRERSSQPREKADSFKALLSELGNGPSRPDRFLVKTGERWLMIRCADIQWIDAEGNYVRLHVDGATHMLRHTMAEMLSRLDSSLFKRIHRSTIVNLDFVRDLQPWTGGDMTVFLRDGTRLTLSRTYREQFDQWR